MQQKIFDIASTVLGISVNEDTTMENARTADGAIAWDSLRTLQIIMALDEAGISIPLEQIADIKGAADLVRFASARA